MANCYDLFLDFHEKIKLAPSKKEYLKKARKALRERIKEYFIKVKKETPPSFWGQGSYMMSTIINPIDGEYDIDDGVYLQNIDKEDKTKWPEPETVHKWIYEAVKEHTKEEPIDKETCIRVIYAGDYHVDLPIYGEFKGKYYLAEKGEKGWHISDPKALTDWFKNKTKGNDQIKRLVRYLKAWADYKSKTNNVKLPSGLILTILVVDNFIKKEREDLSFCETIKNICQNISNKFVVYNPVDQNEILTERLTNTQKQHFKELFNTLMDNAIKALEEKSRKEACRLWRKEFGDRFPSCEDIEEIKEGIIKSVYVKNLSKPWSK